MDDMTASDKSQLITAKKEGKRADKKRGPMSLENPVYDLARSEDVQPTTSDA